MSDFSIQQFTLPPEQQAIRDKCYHPSGTFVEFPIEDIETSIPDRFEKIVRLYHDRPAVKMSDRTLTYHELNQAANRIARRILALRGQGSEPIALLFEHGIDVIAAILGVLKAGKFYIALSPSFPTERNHYILNDSQARLIITNGGIFDLAFKLINETRTVLNIRDIDATLSADNLTTFQSPEDLAAIRYTSGSTGEPKGVAQTHQKILHAAMLTTNDELRICAEDRLTLIHLVSFGSAYSHLFGSLLNGACLLPFDIKSEGIHRFAKWIEDEQVTILKLPPPAFRQLAESLSDEVKLPALRLIHLSGGPITQLDFELYKNKFIYGPLLEISMGATEIRGICFAILDSNYSFPKEGSPIGYPRRGRQILLVDENGREVEPDQLGEIAVKGRELTLGYWRNPELTEAKLVRGSTASDEQLYLTGDLGRKMPDGMTIHLRRKDFMVKIRGYRVELSEIENALLDHPQIRESAVAAWEREPGNKYLAGYVVRRQESSLNVSDLNEFLRTKLPDYMVPSTFMFLESLPLTNGKLDRLALPKPDYRRPELKAPYVSPRTDIERRLSRIWSEILSLDGIGTHDNFFDLGGHSLSGSKLICLIQQEFNYNLPVSEFFAKPTIAQLAERIETASEVTPGVGNKAWSYLCELQRANNRKPIFIFPGGGGGEPEFFVYGFLARHVGTEYPFYGLQARGADGTLQPHTSVAQMADAYVQEIRAMQPVGPYFLVGECAGGVNAYEAACQLMAQGQQVAMLVLMDVERPRLTKYLRFRASRWNAMIRYYLARIPIHAKQLRALRLNEYPGYFINRIHTARKPTEQNPKPIDSRHERAAMVLRAGASGQALKHTEWVRENYRRTVRRFTPKPYNGDVEIIISEKLYRQDPTLGWKKLALKGVNIHPVPGDHWSYIRDHVSAAGSQLRDCIERAQKQYTETVPKAII